MSSGKHPMHSLCIGLMLAGPGTALAAASLPAQTSHAEIVRLARGLGYDPAGIGNRIALRELVQQREIVDGELVETLLVRLVVSRTLDDQESIEVLELLGGLGPRAAAIVTLLEEGFEGLPLEVWPATLDALGKIGPYGGAGRMSSQRLLDSIFRRIEEPGDRHHEVFIAWIRLDERSRNYPSGSTESLLGKLSRGWGGGLGVVVEELGRRGNRAALGPLRDYLERGLVQMVELTKNVRGVRIRFPFRDAEMMTAAQAMVKIDASHPDSLIAHAVLLRHPDPMVRQRSMNAFGPAGSAAADAVPFLRANLFDAPAEVIADSCTVLGMIGPDARAAIIALEQLSEHQDRQIAERAVAALRRIR